MSPTAIPRHVGLLILALTATRVVAQAPVERTPPEAIAELEARLRRQIVEQGVVESAEQLELFCGVQGESTIRFVVEEGTLVHEGDLLLSLDDTTLREQLATQEQACALAENALIAAKAAAEAAKRRLATSLPVAELRLKVAERTHDRFLSETGELATEGQQLARVIAVATQRIATLQSEPDSSEQNDALRDLAVAEAETERAEAEAALQLLMDHIRPQETAARELAIAEARLALTETQTVAEAAVREAEAEVHAAEASRARALEQRDHLHTQIAACDVRAPRDGIVLHAQPRTSRSSSPAIAAASKVRERQPLLTMPNLAKLQVRVRVHESQIARVKVGQPVTLACDAAINQRFAGQVTEIGRTPVPTTFLTADVVEYPVVVALSDAPAFLRIGMTATAEIDVSN
jgi:HlyD family secretion protein